MSQLEMKRKQFSCYSTIACIILFILFTKTLGDNGATYLGIAFFSVMLFSLPVQAGVVDTISRIHKSKRKREQYRSLVKFRSLLWKWQAFLSVILCISVFFVAPVWAEMFLKIPYASSIIRVLAPLVVIKALQSVLQGYYMGKGMVIPFLGTAVGRPVLYYVFCQIFAAKYNENGIKIATLLNNTDFQGMHCAYGAAIGVVISELLLLLGLFILYLFSNHRSDRRKIAGGLQKTETFGESMKMFYTYTTRDMITYLLLMFPLLMGIRLFQVKAADIHTAEHLLGATYIRFILLCAIPVIFSLISTNRVLAATRSSLRKKDMKITRDISEIGLHYNWIIGLFFTAFYLIMAPQISHYICGAENEALSGLIRGGCVFILFTTIAIHGLMVFKAYDDNLINIGALLAWAVAYIFFCTLFLKDGSESATGLAISAIVANIVLVALLYFLINQKRRIRLIS